MHLLISLAAYAQAGSDFWKKKLNPPVRKPRADKTLAQRKKTAAQEIPESNDSEVKLDSFGCLFIQLTDNNYSQGKTDMSRADAPEVTNISSDLENFPPEKIRRVIRKVPFSHPLAYLDSRFLLKKQQHTSKRQTRSACPEELMTGLPNSPAPRKWPAEVLFTQV